MICSSKDEHMMLMTPYLLKDVLLVLAPLSAEPLRILAVTNIGTMIDTCFYQLNSYIFLREDLCSLDNVY
jgi:hypothetical protein